MKLWRVELWHEDKAAADVMIVEIFFTEEDARAKYQALVLEWADSSIHAEGELLISDGINESGSVRFRSVDRFLSAAWEWTA